MGELKVMALLYDWFDIDVSGLINMALALHEYFENKTGPHNLIKDIYQAVALPYGNFS